MKKKLLTGVFAGAGLLAAVLVLLLCLNGQSGADTPNGAPEKDVGRYALNLYNDEFLCTRGLEVFYDENGALKSMEAYLIYDSGAMALTNAYDSQGKYPDAVSACVVNDDGTVKLSNYVTARSVEAGALEDTAFYMANELYDNVKTEEAAKAFFETQKQLVTENGSHADEKNYIIIDGKNIMW